MGKGNCRGKGQGGRKYTRMNAVSVTRFISLISTRDVT